MSRFGQLLREYRNRSRDPKNENRSLTLARFADELAQVSDGQYIYSYTTIANWEKATNTPRFDDRGLLLSMLKVLYKYGGIDTLEEANRLLRAGAFLELQADEISQISSIWAGELGVQPDVLTVNQLTTQRYRIASQALSDAPSVVDLLNFSDYAHALADFIRNEKTEKPLTIGIDAAWGMGKTTLMRMTRDLLEDPGSPISREVAFPTVWFNAWKYDQEESLWSALVLEILSQVNEQSSPKQRTLLWLKLNKERFDWTLLLRSALKTIGVVLSFGLLGALVYVIAFNIVGTSSQQTFWEIFRKYVSVVGGFSLIAALFATGKQIYDQITEPFDLNISKYIREPKYKERIGFLAQFEEDFRRVVHSVTDGGSRPLVVFIDDLDRCSPSKPVEVIEAINILLDAKFCVFVIGMDSPIVAASIESKYSALMMQPSASKDQSTLTLGHRFLEKIVQINFRIPDPRPDDITHFIRSNLSLLDIEEETDFPEEEINKMEQLIRAEQMEGLSLDEAMQKVHDANPNIAPGILSEARESIFAQTFDETEDVEQVVIEAAPFLEFNPRKIKRFINLFRLQAFVANRRKLLETQAVRLDTLAHWTIIATQWPEVLDILIKEPDFVSRLRLAHELRARLEDTTVGAEQIQQFQTELDLLYADPEIRHYVNADVLVSILGEIKQRDPEALYNYYYLAQITTPKPN